MALSGGYGILDVGEPVAEAELMKKNSKYG